MAKVRQVLPEKSTLYQSCKWQATGARYPDFSIRAEAHNLLFVCCILPSETLDLLEYRIIIYVVKLVNQDPFFLCENISMCANVLALTRYVTPPLVSVVSMYFARMAIVGAHFSTIGTGA